MKTRKSLATRESILSHQFRYRPAVQTDVRRTIKREQRRLADIAYTQATASELALKLLINRNRMEGGRHE